MLSKMNGFEAIYLYAGKSDLRKGIDGLAALVKEQFNLNPFQKNVLFLFCGTRLERKTFVRGERPADFLRNSIVTPSLAAGIYNAKYVNAQPIQRLVKEFERCNVFLPEPTMCRWANVCSDCYLKRIYDRLREKLNDYHVLHADETPVEVRKDGRPARSRSYIVGVPDRITGSTSFCPL